MKFICNCGKEVTPPSSELLRVELSELAEISVKPWLYFLEVGFPGLVVKDSQSLSIWIGKEDCYWANVKAI